MIGGIDIRISTRSGVSAVDLEVAVRAIRQRWPHAVFENGVTGDHYGRFMQIPFGTIEEIFVYRDRPSAELWDKEGAVPAAYNTMIHIMADQDLITLVIDTRDEAMNEIVAAVKSALDDDILHIPAERAA